MVEQMQEFTEIEELIVKQAILNAVASDTKTKNPDNLRGRVDAMMEENYYINPMAGRSFDLRLKGQKVGTYSLTVSKSEPQKVETSLEINDRQAFMQWAEENGFIDKTPNMDAIMKHFEMCGEVPEGCRPVEVVTPEVIGGVVTRTTVKVDSKEVARVMGHQLEPMVYAILESGQDGD